MHLSRSTLSVAVVVGVTLLAAVAGCWVTRQPATPPTVTRTATLTAVVITVRPVTNTPAPASAPATETPRATLTATYPVPLDMLTRTSTPNPSTLITPSPAVLPATGGSSEPNQAGRLLAIGVVLLWIGLLARWATAKPKG